MPAARLASHALFIYVHRESMRFCRSVNALDVRIVMVGSHRSRHVFVLCSGAVLRRCFGMASSGVTPCESSRVQCSVSATVRASITHDRACAYGSVGRLRGDLSSTLVAVIKGAEH